MKDIILVNIQGGLGNQMFQYAYGKKIKLMYPQKKLVLDTSYYNKEQIRNISINKMKLSNNVEFDNTPHILLDILHDLYKASTKFNNKEDKQWKLMNKCGYLISGKSYLWNEDSKNKRNYFLRGYFQNEKEIRNIIDILRKDFLPLNELTNNVDSYLNLILKGNCIGVSIRAGEDYVKFGWPMCSKEFYINGIRYIQQKKKIDKIFIFSDSLDKVKSEKWFSDFQNIIYVEGCTDVESMYLLSKCTDFVIANSTFAWWGAYLGDSKNKMIVASHYFYRGIKWKESNLAIPGAIYLDNDKGDYKNE